MLVGQDSTHVDADRRRRTDVAAILGLATRERHKQDQGEGNGSHDRSLGLAPLEGNRVGLP